MATDDYSKIEHDMAAMLRESFPVTWPPGLATKLSLQIESLKYIKAESIVEAFNKILKTGRKPKFLWCDKGLEFYNKDFKKLLSEKGINLYSTENEEKSSVVERWNLAHNEKSSLEVFHRF